jgi:hypothetical protein
MHWNTLAVPLVETLFSSEDSWVPITEGSTLITSNSASSLSQLLNEGSVFLSHSLLTDILTEKIV